jgi:hypothetical protein
MPNLIVCKDCEDHDDFYGCMNQECEVYIDIVADSKYQDWKDNQREEALIEQRR